jgi:hypothetical protein
LLVDGFHPRRKGRLTMSRDQLRLAAGVGSVIAALAALLTALASRRYEDGMNDALTVAMLTGLAASIIAAITSLKAARQYTKIVDDRKVFLVYAKKDVEYAKTVADLLRASGFKPWIDIEDILPGQIWKLEIARALSQSSSVVVIFSENTMNSSLSKIEIEELLANRSARGTREVPIIPIRVDQAPLPKELEDIQSIDFDDNDWPRKLIKGLEFATRDARGLVRVFFGK